MKNLRTLAAAFTAFVVSAVAFAAEASPAGHWEWTLDTPNGAIEASADLKLENGGLSGTYRSPFGEAKIAKGSFANGVVAFEVEREFDGNKFVVKYSGKLDGDSIKGTVQLPGFDGGDPMKMDWNAKRRG